MLLSDLLVSRKLGYADKKQLLEEHRVRHSWMNALNSGRSLRNSDQSIMTKEQIIREHKAISKKMVDEKINHYLTDELDETVLDEVKKRSMKKEFFRLPREVMMIRDFITIDGNDAVINAGNISGRLVADLSAKPNLLSNILKSNEAFTSVKIGTTKGSLPLYDLIIKKNESVRPLASDDLISIDLGCGSSKTADHVGLDKEYSDGVDVVHNLEDGIPYPDNSASEITAKHVFEYLKNPDQIMREIHRVLVKDGILNFEVTCSANGTLADPLHNSVWSEGMLASWTVPEMLGDRPGFAIKSLKKEVVDGRLINIKGIFQVIKGEVLADRISSESSKFIPHAFASPMKKDDKKDIKSVFLAKDEEKRIVKGVVAEPYVPDAVGEWATPEDIEATAHDYMINYQNTKLSHRIGLKKEDAAVVESTIVDADFFTEGGELVRKGSWIMAHKIFNEELWKGVVSGEIAGYSMGGTKEVFS